MSEELNEKAGADVEGLRLPARILPAPHSVSREARAVLARFKAPPPPSSWPALDDAAGWRSLVAAADSHLEAVIRPHVQALHAKVFTHRVGPSEVHVAAAVEHGAHHPVYFDLHGGGFTCLGGTVGGLLAGSLSDRLGMTVWSPDYRMPPDHPFPAGLDDAVAAYADLLRNVPAWRVVVGGQSSGGNLAAALVLRARAEGLPLPAGLVLLTPYADLTESGDSFQTLRLIDQGLPHGLAGPAALYAGGWPLEHPMLSPLFADFSPPFPPTFLQSGTRDILLSNAVRMHQRMKRAGVDVELHLCEAMPHAGFGGAVEDSEVDIDIRAFIRRVLRA